MIEQQEMEKSLPLRSRTRIESRETRLDSRFSLRKKEKEKERTRGNEGQKKTKERTERKIGGGEKKSNFKKRDGEILKRVES